MEYTQWQSLLRDTFQNHDLSTIHEFQEKLFTSGKEINTSAANKVEDFQNFFQGW